MCTFFFFQAEDGIRDLVRSRGLGDVYKRQILMLGSVLGRVNFKAWIPFVALWMTCVYCIDAFLIWGGGYFAQHGAIDYSGGYVIHLSAGVSGFVAAAVIGPRLARDREIDAPNNLAMVALGAGLLWLCLLY